MKAIHWVVIISLLSKAKQQRRHPLDRPNIVMIITDDQDVELGSMEYMQKTLQIFRNGGAEFVNGFVTTPICCPSRTSILTGLYAHNHDVHSNKENCTGSYWTKSLERKTFATYLLDSGYVTGYFGKYLNEYNGSYVPPGWSEWMGLVKNSRFYNYSINYNGKRVKHGDQYFEDYFTDLVVNDSINFFKRSLVLFPRKPVMMVLSFSAPHGPEDPAPHYSKHYANNTTHRTPSWNYAPNPDKQWLLRHTGKMEPVHVAFTDFLHRRRLQTLLSVDDAVAKLCRHMQMVGELENTYMLYTSDHGYHLGQFGLIKGKTLPYEFDIKVPFFARGPNIASGLKIQKPVANIDLAPTILNMAGVPIAQHMDGRSFLPLLVHESLQSQGLPSTMDKPWRHTVLIERGIRPKLLRVRDRLAKQRERLSKEIRIQRECNKTQYQPPCKSNQVWECRKDEWSRWRIFKCRANVDQLRICECEANESLNKQDLPVDIHQDNGRNRRSVANKAALMREGRFTNNRLVFVSIKQMNAWEEEFFEQVVYEELLAQSWHQGIFDHLDEQLMFNSRKYSAANSKPEMSAPYCQSVLGHLKCNCLKKQFNIYLITQEIMC